MQELYEAAGEAQQARDADALVAISREAAELGSPDGIAYSASLIALAHMSRGEFEEAIGHFREAVSRYRELEEPRLLISNIGNLGISLRMHGDYQEALVAHHEEVALAEQHEFTAARARAVGHIATVHKDMGEYPQALEGYHRALDLCTSAGFASGMAANTGNLGLVYFHLGDYPKALESYHKGIELYRSIGNVNDVAGLSGNIGNVYKRMGDSAKAAEWYTKALETHERIGNKYGIGLQHQNLAGMLDDGGDEETALKHFHKARELFEEIGYLPGLRSVLVSLALISIGNGETSRARELLASIPLAGESFEHNVNYNRAVGLLLKAEGDLEGAHQHLETALQEAKQTLQRTDAARLLYDLREIAYEKNDLREYVRYNREWIEIEQGTRGADVQRQLVAHEVERSVMEHRQELERHKAVLYSTLPREVAERVLKGEEIADLVDSASVLFMDIVGFTSISGQTSPEQVIQLLKKVFSTCDEICRRHGLTKIKTIGDSYMAVAFPESGEQRAENGEQRAESTHAARAAQAALDMMKELSVQVRIGLHCGPVIAGIVGDERMQYDVWGDTVNVASRMESNGEPGRIQVSEEFRSLLPDSFTPALRGSIEVKGKGMMQTYWLAREEQPLGSVNEEHV